MPKFHRKHLRDIFRYLGIGAIVLLGLAILGPFLGQYIPFMEHRIDPLMTLAEMLARLEILIVRKSFVEPLRI